MYYFDTPNYSIALNAKVASSSMARAIISQFQPHEDWLIRTAAFPSGVTENDRQWHRMCHGEPNPNKPVVLLIRDPLERFLSACQQIRIRQTDIDSAINSLVNNIPFVRTKPNDLTEAQWAEIQQRLAKRQSRRIRNRDVSKLRQNVHFFHQHKYAVGPTHCFKFPRDILAASQFIGISAPFPDNNKAKRPKPILSQQQQQIILDYYKQDKILFDSIIQPNYIYVPQGV